MATFTAEAVYIRRLMRQQEQTIQAACRQWYELYNQLVELNQQAEDQRPYMRALLAVQGAAAVSEAVRILNEETDNGCL